MEDRPFVFAPFRLDPVRQELRRGDDLVSLRPKLFAVLRYLLEHPGRLVPREELRAAVWPATVISESVLRGTIRELRDALGDDATAARFVETVPYRGYRFVAPVTRTQLDRAGAHAAPQAIIAPLLRPNDLILIGRDVELAQLHQSLQRAMQGAHQVVFITGEPGIGKTTVVDAFLESAASIDGVRTARGQCVDHYGSGEAYLPVLEALGHLCRQPGGERVLSLLSRYAPTWLAQMPALISDTEFDTVQRRTQGATRERMLRELAEAVEAMTAGMTLVLVLEDLHWSDYSTLDLIAVLAQRRAPAGLLLLGTYRPADVIVSGHPLRAMKQELLVHDQCKELPLRFLTDAEVSEYLAARFPRRQLPAELGPAIHRSTEGNPLFMTNVVDYWLSQNLLIEAAGEWQLAARVEDVTAGVPESLRQMIEKQLERLPPEPRRMLEVAGVAGVDFSTAAVAAGLGETAERVEEWCEELAGQGQFLSQRGVETLADGTATGRYGFIHGLYQQVLYERLGAARRARLHQRIGEWAEGAFSARPGGPAAAELAMHFERGQNYPRAIQYLRQAANHAMRRQAPHEAVALLKRSLMLINHLPDSPDRTQDELALLVAMGPPLLMTKGYAADEVARTYARAHDLCRQLGESPQLLPALAGLFRFYFVRADFESARALGEQVLRLAEHSQDPMVFLVAHSLLGALLLSIGEFVAAAEHLEKGIALYDPEQHGFMASLFGDDPGVTCHCFAAMTLWFLGYPDQALTKVRRALTLAKQTGSPYCETFALDFVAWIHVFRREEHAAQTSIDALMRIAPQHGFQFLLADSAVVYGWSLVAQDMEAKGLQHIRSAIAAYEATGAIMSRPAQLVLLAKAYGKAGQNDDELAALEAAREVMEQTGERTYDAEAHRLHGELILHRSQRTASKRQTTSGAAREAEACFQKAIEVARRQRARSLELRAVMDLSRLWQRTGKRKQARQMLGEIYRGFTEGLDTPDLRDADKLLAELA
jgi:DNA-binding winged helix-turn-helix (wHTH) protein/predicted ATPase